MFSATPLSTLHSPKKYLVLHPLVVVGLVPPADEVSHQDDHDHGGQDAAHNDGDQIIGALAIGLAVTGGLDQDMVGDVELYQNNNQ